MKYDFSDFKKSAVETAEWLRKAFVSIQTGRATPALLDNVLVNSYGAKIHVNQLASITVEDARTLRIVPWDTDSIQNIEVAVRDADLGVGISVDEKGIRVTCPELTTETRQKLVKLVKQKLEEARVSLRNERDEAWNDIQKGEKMGDIVEDDKFRFKDEMEKISKDANERLEEISSKKEKEIMG